MVTGASARHYRTLARQRSLQVVLTRVAQTMGQCQPFSMDICSRESAFHPGCDVVKIRISKLVSGG
jgi:hypothetical protein